LVATSVLLIPGILVALAAGLRSMSALALGPLLGTAVLGVSAIVAPAIGLRWGVLPAFVGTVLTVALTFCARAAMARRFKWSISSMSAGFGFTPATIIGLVVGAAVILYRLLQIFGSPDFVSQTADNVFHMNAVRYILETGNASSLTVGAAGGGGASFYPAAWHGLAALVSDASGAPIAASVASLNLAIGALAWPLSSWYLCRTLLGGSTEMNLGFGVLVSAFSAFPYLLIDWGVLYPNYLGMAVLPAVVALFIMLSRNGTLICAHRAMLPWLALMALAGVSLSHPNTVICLLAILVPFLLFRFLRPSVLRAFIIRRVHRPVLKAFLVLALMAGIITLWFILRPFPITSFNLTWPPYQSAAQAVGEALLTTHSARGAAWVTSALLIVGLVVSVTHRAHRWLSLAFIAWTILFIAVTAWEPSMLRAFLTGGWFDDYKRIAAGMVVVALPLALLGFIVSVRLLVRALTRPAKVGRQIAVLAAIFLIAVPTLWVSQTGPIRDAAIAAKSNYNLRAGSPIMSLDEFKLYSELPDLVPENAVIAGNPWDGSAWAYFVSGRHVLYPHVLAAMDKDKQLIANSLRRASTDPAVCEAAERLHVQFAINSDELIYLPGNPNNQAYPGLEHLDEAKGFQLVAQVGANRLYRLTAC